MPYLPILQNRLVTAALGLSLSGLLSITLALGACSAEKPVQPLSSSASSGAGGNTSGQGGAGGGNTCAAPWSPVACDKLTAAPSTPEEAAAFVAGHAMSLRCGEHRGAPFHVESLAASSQGARTVLFGEIHGSNEAGPLSAALANTLVRKHGATAILTELYMDVADAQNEYIDQGQSTTLVERYNYPNWPKVGFRKALTETSRALRQEGHALRMYAIDIPLDLQWVQTRIEAIAETLGSDDKLRILSDLPQALPWGEKTDVAAFEQTAAYAKRIQLDAATLPLEPAQKIRLEALALGLHLGTANACGAFWKGEIGDLNDWLLQREALMVLNVRYALLVEKGRLYGHFGANHTAKEPGWLAHALAADPSHGGVYTTTVGFGSGSAIKNGKAVTQLPSDPEIMEMALTERGSDVWWMPVSQPSADCQQNPLADLLSKQLNRPYGPAYDAVVWFRKLTPTL